MKNNKTAGKAWFEKAFAEDYLFIYAHRSEKEARRQVKVAISHLPFKQEDTILDIACGAGRHMLAFSEYGAKVTGIDLSPQLLQQARKRFKDHYKKAVFRRLDMRELKYKNKFDGATMWFTSLGYFRDIRDDLQVLKGMAKALKSNGWWWLDIANPTYLTANLIPYSEKKLKGPHGMVTVHESRRIRKGRVEKDILIKGKRGERSYQESVRLYTPEQLGTLIKKAGLLTDGIMGDYDGSPLSPKHPRQIWYGRKG